jgi:hypothetical protein
LIVFSISIQVLKLLIPGRARKAAQW